MVEETKMLAVIRIRGLVNVRHDMRQTLSMLRLTQRHRCVVKEKTPSFEGMIKKVKDYVTYGEIDDETYKLLVEKKGEEYKGRETDSKGKINYKRFIMYNKKKIKPYFRLNPPIKGFERKGIKQSFSRGGVLGYRGKKINDLIKRMV